MNDDFRYETVQSRPVSELAKSNELKSADVVWLLMPLWFAIAWVIIFYAFSGAWRLAENRFTRQVANQIPCKKCRFYTNSTYLKCAVRPLEAATEKAIACSDYSPFQAEEPASSFSNDSNTKSD